MTRHSFFCIAFAVCTLTAFSGSSYADIVQCIDERGATTYSNTPCELGSMKSIDSGEVNESLQRNSSQLENRKILGAKYAAAEDARVAAAAIRHFPQRGLASDVETMKAAKASAVLIDQEWELARRSKAMLHKI